MRKKWPFTKLSFFLSFVWNTKWTRRDDLNCCWHHSSDPSWKLKSQLIRLILISNLKWANISFIVKHLNLCQFQITKKLSCWLQVQRDINSEVSFTAQGQTQRNSLHVTAVLNFSLILFSSLNNHSGSIITFK